MVTTVVYFLVEVEEALPLHQIVVHSSVGLPSISLVGAFLGGDLLLDTSKGCKNFPYEKIAQDQGTKAQAQQ